MKSGRTRGRSTDAAPRSGSGSGSRKRTEHRSTCRALADGLYWWTLYLLVLLPVRLLFHVVLPPVLKYVWHNGSVLHLAQDDRPVYERVECVGEDVPYGAHPRERMDVLVPAPTRRNVGGSGTTLLDVAWAVAKTLLDVATCYPRAIADALLKRLGLRARFDSQTLDRAKRFPAILFVHGGGGVAVEPAIQHHQCTAFVRQGDFAVYAIAYPLAPEDPHPHALVSTLRALSWLKTQHGHESVYVVGESAGATLVTVAAALVSNPAALEAFEAALDREHGLLHERVSTWPYPRIDRVVSWYGVLDRESWRGKGPLAFGLAWTFDTVREMSAFPRSWTRVPRHVSKQAKHACDFLDFESVLKTGLVASYPPCLLVSGTTDPLGLASSSRLIHRTMTRLGLAVTLSEYAAGHAFIGLNPFVLWFLQGSAWRELALPATMETIAFLRSA